jgi:DNA-binding GntR family transcriptional regulator/predicted GIY-YIG superfamily endonuclease
MSEPPERTALYRLYDADDKLLYVGITGDVKARMKQHAADKHWWGDVAIDRVEWLDSREIALEAEREAIRAERPRYNHQSNPSTALAGIRPRRLDNVPSGTWRPYEFLAHELRGFIQSGSVRPGDKLPTTRELMDVYGVSSVTVQRSVKLLKAQGFASGRPGFAVCAALPPGFRRESATAPMQEGVIEMLCAQQAIPSPRTCTALEIPPGTSLEERHWVRRIDGRAVELVRSFRHPDATPNDQVHHTTDLVTADIPTTDVVEILGLAPLLAIRRVTYTEDGRPIEGQEIAKCGHVLSITYEY